LHGLVDRDIEGDGAAGDLVETGEHRGRIFQPVIGRRERNFITGRRLGCCGLARLLLLLRRNGSRLLWSLLRRPPRLALPRRQAGQSLRLLLRSRLLHWRIAQRRSRLLRHSRWWRERRGFNARAWPLIRRQRHWRRQRLVRRQIAIGVANAITARREIRRRRRGRARDIGRRPRWTKDRAELRLRRHDHSSGSNKQD
jgi:hypothetical protein